MANERFNPLNDNLAGGVPRTYECGNGGTADAGYVKIAKVKINSSYVSRPIRFLVSTAHDIKELQLRFTNLPSTNPGVSLFSYPSGEAYISNPQDTEYEIYLKKATYEAFRICDFNFPFYQYSIKWEWVGEYTTSVPDGAIKST